MAYHDLRSAHLHPIHIFILFSVCGLLASFVCAPPSLNTTIFWNSDPFTAVVIIMAANTRYASHQAFASAHGLHDVGEQPFSLHISAQSPRRDILINAGHFLGCLGPRELLDGGNTCAISEKWFRLWDVCRLWIVPVLSGLVRYQWAEVEDRATLPRQLFFDVHPREVTAHHCTMAEETQLLVRPENIIAMEGTSLSLQESGGWGGSWFPFYREPVLWRVTGDATVYTVGGDGAPAARDQSGSGGGGSPMLSQCTIYVSPPCVPRRHSGQQQSIAQVLYVCQDRVNTVQADSGSIESAPPAPH